MQFVIVGYGRVGMRTARTLQGEGHDVTIVEHDTTKVERAEEDGFEVVVGAGDDESVLEDAGIADADAIGALTGDINTNFAACVVGAAHGCRTVLRVAEDVGEDLYEKYATEVDEIIYPERLGAAGAKTALLGGNFNVIADLTEDLSIATITIPDHSPVVGERVVNVDMPGEARIYAHGRRDEPMSIPLPQTRIEAGDSIAVMADSAGLSDVRAALGADATAA